MTTLLSSTLDDPLLDTGPQLRRIYCGHDFTALQLTTGTDWCPHNAQYPGRPTYWTCAACCERLHHQTWCCDTHVYGSPEEANLCDFCDAESCCCDCHLCQVCGQKTRLDDFHIECDHCVDHCECDICDGCETLKPIHSDGQCSSCYKESMGTITVPGWEERGAYDLLADVEIKGSVGSTSRHLVSKDGEWESGRFDNDHDVAANVWGVDRSISPVSGCADFYLLEAIQSKVFAGPNISYIADDPEMDQISAQARTQREALIEVLDEQFVKYINMACGGEVRYHQAMKKYQTVVPRGGDRDFRHGGWLLWHRIFERVGPEAVKDCAILLADFYSGGVGGPKWATAANVLYQRLTQPDLMPPWLFVDRVFTMQHNGGMILNKINWKPGLGRQNVGLITHTLGPAHAHNPPILWVLHIHASPEVQALFDRAVDRLNRRLEDAGQAPMVSLRWWEKVGFDPVQWQMRPNKQAMTNDDRSLDYRYKLGWDETPTKLMFETLVERGVVTMTPSLAARYETVWSTKWKGEIVGSDGPLRGPDGKFISATALLEKTTKTTKTSLAVTGCGCASCVSYRAKEQDDEEQDEDLLYDPDFDPDFDPDYDLQP